MLLFNNGMPPKYVCVILGSMAVLHKLKSMYTRNVCVNCTTGAQTGGLFDLWIHPETKTFEM